MKKHDFAKLMLLPVLGLVLMVAGCSKLLPPRKGTAHSNQMVLDTRREPVIQLAGTFIPGIYPAITKIPIVFVQKIPPGAVFKTATVETVAKSGELQMLEPVIEENQVYLKFAVASKESSIQYNVLVRVSYEYSR